MKRMQFAAGNMNAASTLRASGVVSTATTPSMASALQPGPSQGSSGARSSSTVAASDRSSWGVLSEKQKHAWCQLGWNKTAWEGEAQAPKWRRWRELDAKDMEVAAEGLGITDEAAWDVCMRWQHGALNFWDAAIPDGATLEVDPGNTGYSVHVDGDASAEPFFPLPSATKRLLPDDVSLVRSIAQMVLEPAKLAAVLVEATGPWKQYIPVGPIVTSTETAARFAASACSRAVTTDETVIYLDGSGSMAGENLQLGRKAFASMAWQLKNPYFDDGTAAPCRIVKLGRHGTVLAADDDDWSPALVSLSWDATGELTNMWQTIETDIKQSYRPGGGLLRVVIITDDIAGQDAAGFVQPLSQVEDDLQTQLFVVGIGGRTSPEAKANYAELCNMTGGSFFSMPLGHGWNENDANWRGFLRKLDKGLGKFNGTVPAAIEDQCSADLQVEQTQTEFRVDVRWSDMQRPEDLESAVRAALPDETVAHLLTYFGRPADPCFDGVTFTQYYENYVRCERDALPMHARAADKYFEEQPSDYIAASEAKVVYKVESLPFMGDEVHVRAMLCNGPARSFTEMFGPLPAKEAHPSLLQFAWKNYVEFLQSPKAFVSKSADQIADQIYMYPVRAGAATK